MFWILLAFLAGWLILPRPAWVDDVVLFVREQIESMKG